MIISALHIFAAGAPTTASLVSPVLSFNPSRLGIVAVMSSRAASTPNTPTITGASRTFTQIITIVDGTNVNRLTLFRTLASTPNTGAITIDFGGQTQDAAKYSVCEFSGVDNSGTNGSGAVVQSVSNSNSGSQTTLVVTLAAFSNTNNATFGAFKKATTTAAVVGSGFTALNNDTGLFTDVSEWRGDNDTTVDITWASESSITVGAAIEIKAAQSGGFFLLEML